MPDPAARSNDDVGVPTSRLVARARHSVDALAFVNNTLHSINARLGTERASIGPLLKFVLESVQPLLPEHTTGQFLLAQKQRLVIVASTDGGRVGNELQFGKGVAGWVFRANKAVLIGDLEDSEHEAAPLYEPVIPNQRSEVAVPLRAGSRCFGVLNYENPRPNAFTEEHIEILEYLAAGAAAGVLVSQRQQQLFEMSQVLARSMSHAAGVHEALLASMCDLTGAEHAQVLAYEGGRLRIIASTNHSDLARPDVDIDKSVSGSVVRSKQLRNVSNVDELEDNGRYERRFGNEVASELAAPVLVDGTVTHVLNVETSQIGHFGPADEEVLIALSGFAAVADSINILHQNALHQMRAPVHNIVRYAERLDASNADTAAKALEVVTRNAKTLQRVVELLLPREQAIRACNLKGVIEQLVKGHEDRGPRLTVDWAAIEQLPSVRADPTVLCEVLVNLVENAVWELQSARPSTPEIAVRAARAEGFAGVAVHDNGRGVPVKYRATLFDRFVTSKGAKGTGVGLAFVREAMTKMGGQVTFETSDAGTTFTVLCEISGHNGQANPEAAG